MHTLAALDRINGHPHGDWEAVCSCYEPDPEKSTGFRTVGGHRDPIDAVREWLDHVVAAGETSRLTQTTTAVIRSAYVHWNDSGSAQSRNHHGGVFDAWLAEHDAEVKAEALEEAARGAEYHLDIIKEPKETAPSTWLRERAAEIRAGRA